MLGVLDDVARRTTIGFKSAGDVLLLLGETHEDLGGSEWAWVFHRHLGGCPPRADLDAERALADVLVRGAEQRLLQSAHDLSDGGLAQALVECSLRGRIGAEVSLGGDPFLALFSESAARVLVSVEPAAAARFTQLCRGAGVPVARIGTVGGQTLEVIGEFGIRLRELRAASEGTLPRLFGRRA